MSYKYHCRICEQVVTPVYCANNIKVFNCSFCGTIPEDYVVRKKE